MPTLDDVYETYCTLAAELLQLPASGPRAQLLQTQADDAWLDYLAQGGGREPWHKPKVAWQYQDGFQEMRHSSANGPTDQLRELLNLPRNVGPHYLGGEQSAVEHFQKNHGLPVTGVVDRRTWQAILGAKGERKPGNLVRRFELPGTATQPVPIVIRTRKRWMLALDDVPYRTYANQSNLAALAAYAYEGEGVLLRELVNNWRKDRLREDVLLNEKADFSKLFVREAAPQFEHELTFIEDGDTDTQLFVLDSPRYTVVAFRGTAPTVDSVHNAIQDLNSDLEAKGERWMYDGTFDGQKAAGKLGFQVHRGFAHAFDSVRDELRSTLEKYLPTDSTKPIFVTGHSLGAALACLCGCYLRSHPRFSRHPLRLYTFAQTPRVQSIWRSAPLTHPMGLYRRFLMHEFEQHASSFLKGTDGPLPLSAAPVLHPSETQLFHRFVHSRGIPTYHSIDEYRRAFQ